ncbi:MAG: hypothetical protein ACREQQ_09850, partial [Candidatus Binatia bacterium]
MRKGVVVSVLDRKTPIARIVPIASVHGGGRDAELLAEMERKGLVRRGTGRIGREILDRDPPGRPSGVLRALLE